MNQINLTLSFSNAQLAQLATVAESRNMSIAQLIEISMASLYYVPAPQKIEIKYPSWMEHLSMRSRRVLLNELNITTIDELQNELVNRSEKQWHALPNCGISVYNELRVFMTNLNSEL